MVVCFSIKLRIKESYFKFSVRDLSMAFCLLIAMAGCSKDESNDASDDIVVDDEFTFAGGQIVSVPVAKGVLFNDGSDFVSVSVASNVDSTSSLALKMDGSFTYTPGETIETDSFTYSAVRMNGDPAVGTVNINVARDVTSCTEINVNNNQSIALQSPFKSKSGLNYIVSNSPIKGFLSDEDSTTGDATYTHNAMSRGQDGVTYKVTDNFQGELQLSYQLVLTPLRIMPLGDSLTEGVESDSDPSGNPDLDTPAMPDRVGYRKPLFDLLNGAGYDFDFVGSQTDAGASIFTDFQHQGHPGYTDAEISGIADPDQSNSNEFNPATDGVYKWLTANTADIILLHAGTNNIRFRTSSVFIERILDEIKRWQSDNNNMAIKVLVAKIIDKQRNPGDSDNVQLFNINVENLVNSRIGSEDNLSLVDMFSAVPSNLLDPFDKTHLTPAGYQTMGQTWSNALNSASALSKCN